MMLPVANILPNEIAYMAYRHALGNTGTVRPLTLSRRRRAAAGSSSSRRPGNPAAAPVVAATSTERPVVSAIIAVAAAAELLREDTIHVQPPPITHRDVDLAGPVPALSQLMEIDNVEDEITCGNFLDIGLISTEVKLYSSYMSALAAEELRYKVHKCTSFLGTNLVHDDIQEL